MTYEKSFDDNENENNDVIKDDAASGDKANQSENFEDCEGNCGTDEQMSENFKEEKNEEASLNGQNREKESVYNQAEKEGYQTFAYDYSSKSGKKNKKLSPGIIFAVCALLVVAVLLISALSAPSVSTPSTPATSENTESGTEATGTEAGSSQTENNKTVVYGSNAGWVNEGVETTNDAVVNATYHVIDSVVAITTEVASYSSYYGNYVSTGAGSGVIIAEEKDENGNAVSSLIITNNHVIESASTIKVTLSNGDSHDAELVGTDALTDIAVVRINATGLSIATFGNSSEVKLGQTVIAIGNPLGALAGTVSRGVISGLERDITIDGVEMTLLQTDTSINPGNSGGGLFNINGELVGIVNAKQSGTSSSGTTIEGIGFAIPIDTAKAVASDIISYGYVSGRCQIGVTGFSVTSSNYNQYNTTEEPAKSVYKLIRNYYTANNGSLVTGFYVNDDEAVSYAEGENDTFEFGDVIAEVGGAKTSDAAAVSSALLNYKTGDTVTVTVYRLETYTASSIFGQRESVKIISVDIDVVVSENKS